MLHVTYKTTDSIKVTTSSANTLVVVMDYSVRNGAAYPGKNAVASIAAATTTTVLAAPTEAESCFDIERMTFSASGGANTITVLRRVSGADYQETSVSLSSGDVLEYEDGTGYTTKDSNGSAKFSINNVTGNLTVGGTLAVTGAFTAAAITGTSGKFNLNTSALPTPPTGNVLHVGNVDAISTNATLDGFGGGAAFVGRRADGTNASKSAIAGSDEPLAQLVAMGYGSTAYSTTRALINLTSAQAWTDANQGTRITLRITPNNSTTLTTAAILDQDSSFTLGTVAGTGTGSLYAGAGTFTGTLGVTGITTLTAALKFNPTYDIGRITSQYLNTIAGDTQVNLADNVASALIVVRDVSSGGSAIFLVDATGGVSTLVSGAANFSATDSGASTSKICVLWNGSNISVYNRYAAAQAVALMVIAAHF